MARRIKQRVFSGSIAQNLASYGTNLAYNAAGAIGAQSFTASVWVKASSETIALGGTHNVFRYAGLLLSQNAATLFVYIDGVIRHTDTTFFPPRANRWVHLTVVCNNAANTISVYSDGELVTATSAVPAWNISVSQTTEIGSNTFTGMGVGSNVARTRLWVGIAMTASQVAALHYDDIDPNSALKVVDAGFSELAGTTMVNGGTLGGTFSFPVVGGWSTDAPGCQVRNALQNLLPQSNVFTNAAWQQLSLTASVSPLAHPTRPGANVYRLTEPVSAATPHLIRQLPVTTTALSGRVVHWTAKVRGGGGRAFVAIFGNGGAWGAYVQLSNGAVTSAPNALSYSVIDLGSSWYQVDVVGVSDGTQASIYLASASGVVTYAGDGSYIDVCDAQYRILDTAADYLDTTTYAVLAGGQGAPPVQNLPLYSQDFSVASWSKTQLDAPVLVSANGGPGGLPIWRLTDTVAGGTHVMAQNVAADTRQPSLLRTITVVAKNETRGWIAVTYDAANQGAYFDLANGAIGTKFFQANSGATARIVALGDGWYSCSITCNAAIASNTTASVYLASADGVVTYAGNGSSVLIGSVSVSNTNGPTAYAATTLSAVNTGTPRYQAPLQNLIRFSSDMTQVAAFALTNLTSIVALGNVGPGGMPAFRMTDNVGAGGHYTTQTISPIPTVGRAYTLSANVRAGTKTAIVLAPEGAGFQVTYDLTAGTATTSIGAPIGTAITALGDGWYRCSLTFVSAGASGYRFYISPTSYVADGTGTMDWCGLQLTEAAGVANYVATGTATLSEGSPRGQARLQNLITYSNDPSNAAWSKAGAATVAANGTAWDLTDSSGAAFQYITTPLYSNPIGGRIYTVGGMVKKTSGGTSPSFGINIITGTSVAVRMNTDNGYIVETNGSATVGRGAELVSVGGVDYWRFWATLPSTSLVSMSAFVFPASGPNGGATVGADSAATTGTATIRDFFIVESNTPPVYAATVSAAINEGAPRGQSPS